MENNYRLKEFEYLTEDRRRVTEGALKIIVLMALVFTFLAKFLNEADRIGFVLFVSIGGLVLVIVCTLLLWETRKHTIDIHSKLTRFVENEDVSQIFSVIPYQNFSAISGIGLALAWICFCILKISQTL